MKLSTDRASPNYHDVHHYIDTITVNHNKITFCISFDTEAGEAECYSTEPDGYLIVKDGLLQSHIERGQINVTWKKMDSLVFKYLKANWEDRESKKETL